MLGGLAIDAVGRYTPLPRIALLLVFGLLMGPGDFNILPQTFVDSFDLLADIALLRVGFLLSGQFTPAALRVHGPAILWISMAAVVTALIVFAVGAPLDIGFELALIRGGGCLYDCPRHGTNRRQWGGRGVIHNLAAPSGYDLM
ncbi:MAG: hypothetical protein OEU26_14195 [Candidatus Tectomicrobia bacterium]|nr:hypothetical protein [Candidatus Tectomicrobia bacterium]